MPAQYVVGTFNGRDMGWIEMFAGMTPMETPVVVIHERYDLTNDQAYLPTNQIKALIAAGLIKRRVD